MKNVLSISILNSFISWKSSYTHIQPKILLEYRVYNLVLKQKVIMLHVTARRPSCSHFNKHGIQNYINFAVTMMNWTRETSYAEVPSQQPSIIIRHPIALCHKPNIFPSTCTRKKQVSGSPPWLFIGCPLCDLHLGNIFCSKLTFVTSNITLARPWCICSDQCNLKQNRWLH